MNASDARLLTESSNVPDMVKIHRLIESSASNGKYSVSISSGVYFKENQVQYVIDSLRRDGFKVMHHKGSDCRGENWNYISVDWER